MSVKALQDYTFVSKYARYLPEQKRREAWGEAVERVRDMHVRRYPQIEQDIIWAFEQVKQRRVLGSQRALQFGGSPIEKKNARIYNCLGVETEFITSEGVKRFSDFKDRDTVVVMSHLGKWRKATVKCYGKDQLYKVSVVRGGKPYEIYATQNHRWILKDGSITDALIEDDQLAFGPSVFSEFDYESATPLERLYWCYGYTYGDGTLYKGQNGEHRWSGVRLCDGEVKYEERFLEHGFVSSSSASIEGDIIAYTGKYLKTLPNPNVDSPEMIRAFVAGYLTADGTKSRSYKYGASHGKLSPYESIQATGQESIDFIRKCFPIAGVYIVSETDITDQETNFGKRSDTTIKFAVTTAFGKTAKSFSVESIEKDRVDNVWCLEVEEDHSFMLPFGLPTGNCIASYVDRTRFFQECFWLLLCGCGTGFSVQKHHVAKLPKFAPEWTPSTAGQSTTVAYGTPEWSGDGPIKELVGNEKHTYRKSSGMPKKAYIIPDSIEGWSDSLGVLLSAYLETGEFPEYRGTEVIFDYSLIRAEGASLGSSSGKAPGPKPLMKALEKIRDVLNACVNRGQKQLRPIDAYDIVMHASDAVLSGGVRRSATICLFSPDDEEMATAKIGNWFIENPQRGRSNNSALLLRGKTSKEDFEKLMGYVREFGEPGFVWSDSTELVVNPCVEIGLYPVDIETGETGWEACNLCEINGRYCKTPEDFEIACRAAAIIGTCQAGYTDLAYLGQTTKKILCREALLGVSITGMMDNPDILFDPALQQKMAKLILDVNEVIATKIGINPTARATCVKPAGTTSCILGTASGIHPHHAMRYIRRSQANYLEQPMRHLKKINPMAVEKSVWNANGTDEVIAFCIEVPKGAKTKNDIDAITLLEYVKLTQQNWVAAGTRKERCVHEWLVHNVSNTITVRPDEWDSVTGFIYDNREWFCGISLLPISGDKDYPQAPFTAIYTPKELVAMYGDGSVMASGLIVDGLHAFNDNLWKACDAALKQGEPLIEPEEPKITGTIVLQEQQQYTKDMMMFNLKLDWVRRAEQFAQRYFDNDIRQMTFCLKDVNNWKYWCDLKREYKEVDFTTMIEQTDETTLEQTIACAGGSCTLSYA